MRAPWADCPPFRSGSGGSTAMTATPRIPDASSPSSATRATLLPAPVPQDEPMTRLMMATAMLQESLPAAEIQRRIHECVRQGLGSGRSVLFLLDGPMRCLCSTGEPALSLPITADAADPLSAAFRSLIPQRIEAAAAGSERLPEALREAASGGGGVAVPLVAHGRALGVLLIYGQQEPLPPAGMLAAFGVQAGLALERAQADDEIRRSEDEADDRLRALSDAVQYSADAILSVDAG